MQLRVVDYCPLYFTELRERPVPSHREGKFVVLRNATTRDAVFSPRQLSTYHAKIVERFLWGDRWVRCSGGRRQRRIGRGYGP